MKTMRWFALSLLVLATALPAAAQTNRGGIAGTIFDPQGAVAPAAKVQIANMGTNQTSTVTASSECRYAVDLLEPVIYTVSAHRACSICCRPCRTSMAACRPAIHHRRSAGPQEPDRRRHQRAARQPRVNRSGLQ